MDNDKKETALEEQLKKYDGMIKLERYVDYNFLQKVTNYFSNKQ